jgi:outer membrane lipoprotein-sorting protein
MMSFPRWFALATFSLSTVIGVAQGGNAPSGPAASPEQIVQQMEHRSALQGDKLKHYTALRHYEVNYKGFGANLDAKMVVEVSYDAPSAKNFRIVSQSGSKILIEKVLKRLLDTEKQATANMTASALTPANYKFSLESTDSVDGRSCYVLAVEPLTGNKLLYRGRIWVDAADFAVVRIEAEPAKNPSFWISSTKIHHVYGKTGAFWLPEENRSVSKIRLGGTAVLTIDYGDYKIQSVAPEEASN